MNENAMEIKSTSRGFGYGEFEDANGIKCSIQESSANGTLIWLGVSNAEKSVKIMPPEGGGWKPFTIPPGTVLINDRMHLNQKQVRKLLPILHRFVETGYIFPQRKPRKSRAKVKSFDFQIGLND